MASPSPALSREQIWKRERDFFDSQAKTKVIKPIERVVLHRYTGKPRSRYHAEFRLGLLGDVAGKTILNVGCGEGGTCVLLAKLGARVTGIDISKGAIRVARQRAKTNGVQCDFIVGPIETASFPHKFDIVLVEALLHHVIHDLSNVVAGLVKTCNGRIVMSEPINLCPALRSLRLKLGTPDATPDERPLEPAEFSVLRRNIPTLHVRHFRVLTRFGSLVLHGKTYENAGWLPRMAYDALVWMDAAMLAVPYGHRLASVAIMWADVR